MMKQMRVALSKLKIKDVVFARALGARLAQLRKGGA
jgi:hypothetical protein